MTKQFSWVLLPYCSLPGFPFPMKSLALSAHMSVRTIHFWMVRQEPSFALERVYLPATNGSSGRGVSLAVTDILTTRGTQGPACPPMDKAQWPQLGPFSPGLLLMWTTGQSAPMGEEQETPLTPLPFLLFFLSLTLPHLPLFSSPLVPDAGIWSKGLSLSWGLETDHLLLAENANFGSGLVSGRAKFQLSSLEAQGKVS